MIPELIGSLGLILAAIITGTFRIMRRENADAHGRAIETLTERVGYNVEEGTYEYYNLQGKNQR